LSGNLSGWLFGIVCGGFCAFASAQEAVEFRFISFEPDAKLARVLDPPLPNLSAPTAKSLDPTVSAAPFDITPPLLRAPGELPTPPELLTPPVESVADWFIYHMDAPAGFTGPSGVLPSEGPYDAHFIPIEDRWRIGLPPWDRYDQGHPPTVDYPYAEGAWYDPYRQNVLKGDYPIIGQNTFLVLSLESQAILEGRQVPTPTTPFESTGDPFEEEFFGNPNQFFYSHFYKLGFELNHGDAAFKPNDWKLRITPVFNYNYLAVNELGVVNPDVTAGETRFRGDFSLNEWFYESKLADLSPDYDFLSVRAGSQFFTSDFRGFIFSDTNRAIRLFGTRNANRDQFNVIWFDQTEKETNSQLNTFDDRHQNTVIANYYRQDFIWPGYTTQVNVHYNRDQPDFIYDRNNFLARPDAVGAYQPHEVESYYLGWTGDGHINRINVSHALYYVFGDDDFNNLAGQPIEISAFMAALELSYDRDWVRFRNSYFYASGDRDINDDQGEGFDSIFDNPNFAGGEFSYWQRQQIGLFGVNLVQRQSLLPDLRSSKIQGQPNYVNPGLKLVNLGMDFDLTPKARLITNANFLWFDETNVLQQYVFQNNVRRFIGTDLSAGIEYRPRLNNNLIFTGGVSGLIPGTGFQDLYNPLHGEVNALFASFLEIVLQY